MEKYKKFVNNRGMRIVLASDHVGRSLKDVVVASLQGSEHQVEDLGTHGDERAVYADQALKAADKVARGEADRAILCCGGGIGMAIAANKVAGIRAAACTDVFSAVLGRGHQDTNVLAMSAGAVGPEAAKMMAKEWLAAPYDGGIYDKGIEVIAQAEKAWGAAAE